MKIDFVNIVVTFDLADVYLVRLAKTFFLHVDFYCSFRLPLIVNKADH